MNNDDALSRTDYLRFCQQNQQDPDLRLPPYQRRASLPSWMNGDLVTTAEAQERMNAWIKAGRPETTTIEVERTFRFAGSAYSGGLLGRCLASGSIAPPALWFLLGNVAVFAVGRSERGIAMSAAPPRYRRVIGLNDEGITDEDFVSLFLHECAHAWLLPTPIELSVDEDVLFNGPYVQDVLKGRNNLEAVLTVQIRDEEQACRLAQRWGATGLSIDLQHCTRELRLALFDEQSRQSQRQAARPSAAMPENP